MVSVMDLPLPKPESAELGVELRRYRGSVSDTYTSALVPAALTIDLQSYLVWTMVVLSSEMGIARTSQIPDLYLAGSGDALDRIREEIGFDVPIEPDGFYSAVGANPAVYIRTDYPLTSILRLLTHEYVHLALDEMSGGVRLPAWIDEGLATYAEYSLGLRSVRPDATRAQMYASIDVVKNAAERRRKRDTLPADGPGERTGMEPAGGHRPGTPPVCAVLHGRPLLHRTLWFGRGGRPR